MAFDPKEHITNLRGKQYLEVKWRLVWFRQDHPNGGISSEVVNTDPILVRAVITSEGGQILATGHGTANDSGQNVVWKGKAIEKAETAAIGRALAHAGYGTQFSPDDDEDGVVDSPVQRQQTPSSVGKSTPAPTAPAQPEKPATSQPDATAGAVKYTVNKFYVNLNKRNEPYLVFTVGEKLYVYCYSRELFQDAGYDTENWKTVGYHEMPVPAVISAVSDEKGKFLTVKNVEMVDLFEDKVPA